MKFQSLMGSVVAAMLLLPATHATAWDAHTHRAIARVALSGLQAGPREELRQILGAGSTASLLERFEDACNWPDTVRKSPQWTWSAPQHYVNLPRHDPRYVRERDCPDGRCATEAILKYAASLSQPELDRVRRRQALGWVCHLVADLHQPLHAGFRDDRGGNRVTVTYRGEGYNLHEFWDRVLPRQHLGEWQPPAVSATTGPGALASNWKPANVVAWTVESHALALAAAYPPGPEITEQFASASRDILWGQWQKAAERLALLLNTVLSEEALRQQP